MGTDARANIRLSDIIRRAIGQDTFQFQHIEEALEKWLLVSLRMYYPGFADFTDESGEERSDYYLIELDVESSARGLEIQKTLERILEPIMQEGGYIERRPDDDGSEYDIAISRRLFNDPKFFSILEDNQGFFSEIKKHSQCQQELDY